MILTADHGNSDQMVYEDGNPHTSHTCSPVPFAFYNENFRNKQITIETDELSLKDIAPTILYTMGIDIPKNFEGKSVFK